MRISSIIAAVATLPALLSAGIPITPQGTLPIQLQTPQAVSMVGDFSEQLLTPRICKLLPNFPGCEKHRPQK